MLSMHVQKEINEGAATFFSSGENYLVITTAEMTSKNDDILLNFLAYLSKLQFHSFLSEISRFSILSKLRLGLKIGNHFHDQRGLTKKDYSRKLTKS